MSNYNQSIDFLLSLETQGIKMGLKRTQRLLNSCNNPEKDLRSVQIIGTNGKGSTASSLSSILERSQLRVGLYTSPHLVKFNERIQINRECISDDYINYFIKRYRDDIINLSCTFFEVMTVMALTYFKDNTIDIALLETGLGGQFDSVTACKPSLQLFTSISKDHMHILGNSLDEIATEKAKAIQLNIPCISAKQNNIVKPILDYFAKKNNTQIIYSEYFNYPHSPLMGKHQEENINLAISAAKHLIDVKECNIIDGIKNIHWPGRNQILRQEPTIIFDVSHNESSLFEFINTMKSLDIKGKKVLLLSLQNTKDISQVASSLTTYFDYIVCTKLNDRMYDIKQLMLIFNNKTKTQESNDPYNTLKTLVNNLDDNDLLAIVGSHYWGPYIQRFFKNSFAS